MAKPKGEWFDSLFRAPKKRTVTHARTLSDYSGEHCPYCGDQMLVGKWEGAAPSRDHVLPKSRGHTLKNNRIVCCKSCNGAKSNRSLVEWLIVLLQSKKSKDATRARFVRALIEQRRRSGLKIDDHAGDRATTA